MCGIIAYLGHSQAKDILVEGLKRLEYRGYDSSGIAILEDGIKIIKSAGRISCLEKIINELPQINGTVGIAHTRWATHGAANETNAHPHSDNSNNIALVHNGIIENYLSIDETLSSHGIVKRSETDTETIANLIGWNMTQGAVCLEDAVRAALNKVRGAYAIAVVCGKEPEKLVVARNGSPLIIGCGVDSVIVASDASAVVEHTTRIINLGNNQIATIRMNESCPSISIKTIDNVSVKAKEEDISDMGISSNDVNLGEYQSFMLKEIMEQPDRISDLLRGRIGKEVKLGGLEDKEKQIIDTEMFTFIGHGTARNACLIGSYQMEELARIKSVTEYASELRYRHPVYGRKSTTVVVSQSGETADTLACLQEAKKRGSLSVGIINVVGSSIPRETDAGVYLRVGAEIGVASTKAFTGQLAALTLFSLWVARRRDMSCRMVSEYTECLGRIPEQIEKCLSLSESIKDMVGPLINEPSWLFLGRGYSYPVALEGALKLKEISYIHAEGMPASEMKHGSIALLRKGTPVVFLVPEDSQYDKSLANMSEVKSRGAYIVAIANEGDDNVKRLADKVIYVPKTLEQIQPIISVIPLQLIAYHVAILKGCDVDKPRNLAKSVTVE